MRAIKLAAAAVALLGVFGFAVPGQAATLFSISGVVGDANLPCHPTLGVCAFNQNVLLSSQGVIDYSGPTSASVSFRGVSVYDRYICDTPGGCLPGDLQGIGGDDSPTSFFSSSHIGATSFSEVFDTRPIFSTRVDEGFFTAPSTDVPSFPPICCQGSIFEIHYVQITNVDLGISVSPDDIGQAYSLTISTVPEPATWAMFLLGFGAVGFAMRGLRPKEFVAAQFQHSD